MCFFGVFLGGCRSSLEVVLGVDGRVVLGIEESVVLGAEGRGV